MPHFCVCFQRLCRQPFPVIHNCSWTVFCTWEGGKGYFPPSDSATGPDDNSWYVLKPSLLLLHILYMPFSPYHLPSVIFHLLGNPPTSLHYIKGAKINHLDNRPYSLLPFFCNVMDSIITVDTKSLLFSTNIISDHQFCFRSDHSTLDMLPLLTKQ